MTQNGAAIKHGAVEEAIDLVFYRPLGFAVAKRLEHTFVTPNQVTLANAALGVIAGHLFMYGTPVCDIAGAVLFVAAQVFDSADGQLARLTNRVSRAGRIMDGAGDGAAFLSVYLHIALRTYRAGGGAGAFWLAALALISQGVQNSMCDYYRNAYLACGLAAPGAELDSRAGARGLYEEARRRGGVWQRMLFGFYKGYVARQELLAPRTAALAKTLAALPPGDPEARRLRSQYEQRARKALTHLSWIGLNVRTLILLALLLVREPGWFLAITIGPLNVALLLVVFFEERHSRRALEATAENALGSTPS